MGAQMLAKWKSPWAAVQGHGATELMGVPRRWGMAWSRNGWQMVTRRVGTAAMSPSAARRAAHHAAGRAGTVVRTGEAAAGLAAMRSYSSARYSHRWSVQS